MEKLERLTATQIDQLYQFTRQHYVEFYDVQTELVDHLANDIEEIWEDNSNISFEKARDISFKKFGIFGFMNVVEHKQKAMNKKYGKILLCFTKEWFTLPKIVITATIFILFYSLLQVKFSEHVVAGVIIGLLLFDLLNIILSKIKKKKSKEKEEKIFLLESMIGETKNGYTYLIFINLFNFGNLTRMDFSSLAIHWLVAVAMLATLLCILFYIVNYVIPKKAEELLNETYPEYKFVK